MSLPTIEVVSAPAVEALRNSPHDVGEVEKAAFQEADGVIKIYSGLQHEDKRTYYQFVAWESLEHHQKIIADTHAHDKLKSLVGTIYDLSTEPIKVVHVQPSKDPYKAFGAPVLEWCIFYLNESNSASKEKKAELQDLVEVLVGAVTGGEGVVDALWGSVVERPNAVAMLIGWTSVDAHFALVTGIPQFEGLRQKFFDLGGYEVVHIPLALW
ncbi:hypothetical protein C8Q74DRAFT_1362489 [Fomes fomentarius]|nr:hypothetical protein C8Q74DRAFT_1362489 [Fomes fomentarius]